MACNLERTHFHITLIMVFCGFYSVVFFITTFKFLSVVNLEIKLYHSLAHIEKKSPVYTQVSTISQPLQVWGYLPQIRGTVILNELDTEDTERKTSKLQN